MTFQLGHPQYNTGRTHFKKGVASTFKGKQHTPESKQGMSQSQMGRKAWNKGLSGVMPEPWNKGKTGLQVAWNKGIPMSEETKKKDSISHLGKRTGEENNKWKGGITPETNKRIAKRSWRELRKQIYERDNWLCQICGKHCKGDIQCHHVIPYRVSQDDKPSNLITLCLSCHYREDLKFSKAGRTHSVQGS